VRLKNLKKMSFMLSVAIVLTGLVFPVTSSAKDAEKGDIVFADAKLKEVDLSSTFITTFNIADSIENAKFAVIDDGTPKYFTVIKVNDDNTRTPLELKTDAEGNVCTEIVYPEKGITELPYEVIAVDSKLAPVNTKLGILYSNESDSRLVFKDGIASLSYFHFYFYDAVDYLQLNKIDKGVPGKIRIDAYMGESPFKSISYKTSKDGEFKELSYNGGSSDYIDLKSKYFALKYEMKDEYYAFNVQRLIDGDSVDISDIDEGKYEIEIDDISKDAPASTDPLTEFGYRLLLHCQSYDSGVSYPENITGKVVSTLNAGGTVKTSDVVIDGLTIKTGKLRLYGARSGVTPCNLTVKGINKVEYLVFDTAVTVTCEPGASLAFDHFSYEEPDPKEPKPVFEFKTGENTVYDKEAKMFRSSVEPTEIPKLTVTATPTPVATATTSPTPTVAATATPTPTAAATATPAPTLAEEATATPTATPAPAVAAEEPMAETPAATDAKIVTAKSYVYKIDQANTASLQAVNPKDKNISVPASIKVDGKSYKVTKINANAFRSSKVQNVTLGKNVKTIESQAFINCKKLISLKTNENLQEIQADAFIKCPKFRTLIFKSKKMKTLSSKAFSGTKLSRLKVQIPKKMKKKYSKMLIKAKIKKSNIKFK